MWPHRRVRSTDPAVRRWVKPRVMGWVYLKHSTVNTYCSLQGAPLHSACRRLRATMGRCLACGQNRMTNHEACASSHESHGAAGVSASGEGDLRASSVLCVYDLHSTRTAARAGASPGAEVRQMPGAGTKFVPEIAAANSKNRGSVVGDPDLRRMHGEHGKHGHGQTQAGHSGAREGRVGLPHCFTGWPV